MDKSRTIAWITYSLALASDSAPADYTAILPVADVINHCAPTRTEFQSSVDWLISAGLAARAGAMYQLTDRGRELFERCSPEVTTLERWALLTDVLSPLVQGES